MSDDDATDEILFDNGNMMIVTRYRPPVIPWAFGAAEATWLFHVQEFSNYLLIHEEEAQRRLASPLQPGDFCRLHDTFWIVARVDGPSMVCLMCLPPFTAMHTATMYVNRWAERAQFSCDTEQRILRRMDRVLPESLRLPTGPYPGQRFY
jgi:hypothetical protein